MDSQTFAAVIGRRIRQLREQAGKSQDEAADAARRAGLLDWTRGAVASLETGRRRLDAEELLLLPSALVFLDDRAHSLAELFEDAPDWLELKAGGEIPTAVVRDVLRGEKTFGEAGRRLGEDLARHVTAGLTGAVRSGLVSGMARREPERYAARTLGVSPEEIVEAAVDRWGHGLSEERERRLEDRFADEEEPSRSAMRGYRAHATRKLLGELEPMVRRTREGKERRR